MAKDYGYNRRSSRQRSSGPHQFLVICASFLIGYLTASVFDIETLSRWINTQVLAHQESKPEATVHSAPKNASAAPKPKFEFYTLLANEKVPGTNQANTNTPPAHQTPAPSTKSSVALVQPPAPPTKIVSDSAVMKAHTTSTQNSGKARVAEGKPLPSPQENKGAYLVQVASFKARPDAEQMKGLLTLKGYNVTVVPVSRARENWFRVVVGPYPNRDLAQKVQGLIARKERLHGMVTKAG